MASAPHITFILNPVAGRGRARSHLKTLQVLLKSYPVSHSLFITSQKGEATILAQQASRTSSIVVAVGGDGTVNEVATGLIGSNSALGVISDGSGNDFARTVNASHNIEEMLERFTSPSVKQFDVGKALLTHIHGTTETRYFFNSIGIGFDATVAEKVRSIKWLKGIPLYLTALFSSLIGYPSYPVTMSLNGTQWRNNYFLVCAGIGKWEGGGFKLTPDAKPDDGKFQICCIYGQSIIKVLPILPSIMTGTHIGKKHVEMFDTASATIESELPLPVHGDGENFGTTILKADISIVPSALSVIA